MIDWSSNLVVIAGKGGRLGNRLLHFAQFIAYCIEHDLKLVDLTFIPYASYFESTRHGSVPRYPASLPEPDLPADDNGSVYYYHFSILKTDIAEHPIYSVVRRPRNTTFFLDGRIARLARHRPVLVGEWLFRNRDLFTKYIDVFWEFFRPAREIEEKIAGILAGARDDSDVVIGVHIRHGDYRVYFNGDYFFSAERYAVVLRAAERLFPGKKVRFLVCSDEPQDPGAFANLDVRFPAGNPVQDMYTLAACDYIVGPPSTFSGWASIYGQKRRYSILDPEKAFTLDDFVVFQGMSDTLMAKTVPTLRPGVDWSGGTSF